MLDPYQLRVFLTVAETLNFTRAAEHLHMSQPSITQHIQLLEAQLNSALFTRTNRRVDLTETGHALIPLARQIVTLAVHSEEVMEALKDTIHGQLVIACSTTPGKYILPVLLAEFIQQHPMVQAVCEMHARARAFELLEQERVHIALSNSIEEFNQSIDFKKFISDPVVLITPLDHPWAHRGEIEPAELLAARFIFRESTSGTYRVTRSALAQAGINIADLHTILTLGNSEALAIAVQQGVGIAFVSQMVAAHMVKGQVAQVKVRGVNIHQDVYLCRHRYHPFGSVQSAFWEFSSRPDSRAMLELRESTR